MKNDHNSKDFTKWLDKLQQESWQLELIVSGFVIFGLFQALDPVKETFSFVRLGVTGGLRYAIFIGIIGFSVLLSMHLLLFNLLVHLVLRGLWIGAVGLRYYSGDIDYDNLNYAEKFKKYLHKKIGSFDDYIMRLEDYCSIIFSLSFLLVFIFLSFAIVMSLLLVPATFFPKNIEGNILLSLILVFLIALLLFMVLLTMIDFFGQGILKKNKIIAKLYFPVYWVMSYVTLSFLYRPILYNFLDHKKGRRILFWLFPFYIGILIPTTLSFEQSNYHNYNFEDSPAYVENSEYLTMLEKDKNHVFQDVVINSKVVYESGLQIIIVHTDKIENAITEIDTTLLPKKDKRGLYSELIDNNFVPNSDLTSFSTYLNTLNSSIVLKIDDSIYKTEFLATTLINEQKAYETFINIENLSKGKHIVKVETSLNAKNVQRADTLAIIPFWYFGN